MSEGAVSSSRRADQAYVVSLVGPAATSAGYVAVHESVPPGIFAMTLVVSVLAAAVLGGSAPGALAAALSLVGLALFHEPAAGGSPRLSLNELELLGGFLAVAVATVTLITWGMDARDAQVRAELRWERLGRVVAAASDGLSARQMVALVGRELRDELPLEMVRYEPEPRTTCSYRVGRHGGLYRNGDRLEGQRLRLPGEPVGVSVRSGGRDLGQLVLIPRAPGSVTEDQLLLTANLTDVIAGQVEAESAPDPKDTPVAAEASVDAEERA